MRAMFFALAGGVLLILAVVQGFAVRRDLRKMSVAAGLVIDVPHGGSHPVVRFRTADGEVLTFTGNGWIGGYAKGDRVSVRYHPERPPIGPKIDAIGSVWAWVIASATLGTAFLLGGWLIRKGVA
ncbi:MAG: DUF3592 domain-containing protein [Sphingomonas paucimobilis]